MEDAKRGGYMEVSYSPYNTKVLNSYLLTTKKAIREEVQWIKENREARGYIVSRTTNSYVREWKGHNRLYKWNILRNHTKDVDLDENMSLFWEIVWIILGGI